VSLSTPGNINNLEGCSKLKSLVIREGPIEFDRIRNCHALESVSYPLSCKTIVLPDSCDALKSITIHTTTKIELREIGNLNTNESLSDIYFTGDVFPTLVGNLEVNPNVTIHVPMGTKDAYLYSGWKGWKVVEDLPAIPTVVKWDYCGPNESSLSGIGVGNGDNDVEFAMRIPISHLEAYKGCKITAIEYYSTGNLIDDIPDYVFLTTDNVDYLAKQAVSVTQENHWTRVYFDDPFTIDGVDDIYAGFGRHSALFADWTDEYMVVDDGFWLRVMGDDYGGYYPGEWYKHANQQDWNHPLAIRAIIEGENLPVDVVVAGASVVASTDQTEQTEVWNGPASYADERGTMQTEPTVRATIPTDSRYFSVAIGERAPQRNVRPVAKAVSEASVQEIKLKVRNRTPRTVRQLKVDVVIDGAIQYSDIAETVLLPNHEDEVYIPLPASVEGRNHDVTLNVSEIDGEPDMVPVNSTPELSYSTLSNRFYHRKHVFEEATGTWCAWCPRGIAIIEYMNQHAADSFIAICVHNDNEMYPDDSYTSLFHLTSFYPSARFNRMGEWFSPFLWDIKEEYMKKENIDRADAQIAAQAQYIGNNKVEVETQVEFGFSDNGSTEYRIAYVVLEDKVGPYLQANYYSNPEREDDPEDYLNWWYHQGSYPEILFNDVARSIIDYEGVEGLLPDVVDEGVTYSTSYTLNIPDNVDNPANVKIVAMLIDSRTGEIMNADRTESLGDQAGITDITTDSNSTSAIYDLCGRRIAKPAKKGIYICNGVRKIY